ncbi:catalase, partial [Salmonella enterica subsp. enterica]|nr:catalase [Salmonella enterica subsp. enterica serovar Paratyphi A]
SDRAIPRSLRFMEGFGVHTFRLLNDRDEATFVKFHWKPALGLQSTLWDEAAKLQGADNDFHRRDLYESIDKGDYPAWDLGVQIISEEEAGTLPFDILDPTKLVPEELFPVEIVGTMTLNRNPANFFAETEQVAFLPSNVPPGVDFSDDPLLQGRLFSYLDTQLSRLGTPNWHQLPINQPKGCPMHNFQRDGQMQHNIPAGRANYEPNSLARAGEPAGPRADPSGFRSGPMVASGEKRRIRSETFADHYSQARLFYRSQSETEQNHIAGALIFELSKVTLPHVREAVLANMGNVDEGLAKTVADGLGVNLPEPSTLAAAVQDLAPSPALRIIGKYPETLRGRCVAILVGDGSDAAAVSGLKQVAEKAGATVKIVAEKIAGAKLSDGSLLPADAKLEGAPSVLFDAVAAVLSAAAVERLMSNPAADAWFRDAFVHLKAISATSEVKPLLEKAGVKHDERVLSLPIDQSAFVKLAAGRQWDRELPPV